MSSCLLGGQAELCPEEFTLSTRRFDSDNSHSVVSKLLYLDTESLAACVVQNLIQ